MFNEYGTGPRGWDETPLIYQKKKWLSNLLIKEDPYGPLGSRSLKELKDRMETGNSSFTIEREKEFPCESTILYLYWTIDTTFWSGKPIKQQIEEINLYTKDLKDLIYNLYCRNSSKYRSYDLFSCEATDRVSTINCASATDLACEEGLSKGNLSHVFVKITKTILTIVDTLQKCLKDIINV